MSNQKTIRLSLQITISVLFIALFMVLSTILSLENYNKNSDILLTSAKQVYKRLTEELILDFKSTYSPLASTLQLLAVSSISSAASYEERIKFLQPISIVLQHNRAAVNLQVAYPDGGYFVIRTADSAYIRKKFNAPDDTWLIVDNVATQKSDKRTLNRYFYDSNLAMLAQNKAEDTVYDPRTRSWYIESTHEPVATKPYIFFFTQQVGITVRINAKEPGVVVAADFTLEGLSHRINEYLVTPGTEALLINADGQTYAYKDPDKLIRSSGAEQLKLANMKQLGSDVLSHLNQHIEALEQNMSFQYKGQEWIGSSRIIGKPGGIDLFALIVSPVDELLSEAATIRSHSFMIAAVTTLLFIPIIWLVAKLISKPLYNLAGEADSITHFKFEGPIDMYTHIKEVGDLSIAMDLMKSTLNRFIKLIRSLSDEQNLDALLQGINKETMEISKADGVLTYLINESDDGLTPGVMCTPSENNILLDTLPDIPLIHKNELTRAARENISNTFVIDHSAEKHLAPILDLLASNALTVIALPLSNRQNDIIGMLCLLFKQTAGLKRDNKPNNLSFIEAFSGFAAVTLESRQLLNMQEVLLNSFIKLIAGAIDAKSPYTGGHCQRVPQLTKMLAKAACESETPLFKGFKLSEKEWETLDIASWLHDCGKVTTPEYVVDKATKLETIFDRIHEIRMRFEVLKRDANIHFWQQLAQGGNKQKLSAQLKKTLQQLDADFVFIAECNEGGEFMADEKIARLHSIAELTWERTLDDRIGISWEENNRMQRTDKQPLPVIEKLLADKPEHIIARAENEKMPADNPWGFKLKVPEHKYNRGELHNLTVKKGTLNNEERYAINDHMTQTIMMLEKLPYPKHLREVPNIAGGHHETMDGKGYPKQLTKDDMPLTARIMAIADIFEALTASDRPYKKAKTLSEAIRIMSFMRNDKHIDPDLFELFLKSGVFRQYGEQFLETSQLDDVDINDYLPAR